jgi:hypothetical protein
MFRYFHCPSCRARYAVRVTWPAEPRVRIESVAEALETKDAVALPVRILRLLAKRGKDGMTVRELQRALKGPKVDAILEALIPYMDDAKTKDDVPLPTARMIMEETRGRKTYFVLRSAAWKDIVEEDAASVTGDIVGDVEDDGVIPEDK